MQRFAFEAERSRYVDNSKYGVIKQKQFFL
jgi:hypothetical protein